MSHPWTHSLSSARKFGGKPEDYVEIHTLLDASKSAVPTNFHRCATHNSWFICTILPRIKFQNSCESTSDCCFHTIINSDGKHVPIRDIGLQHVQEDFRNKFIPTLQDYTDLMDPSTTWIHNAIHGYPNSYAKLHKYQESSMKQVNVEVPVPAPVTDVGNMVID